MLCRRVNGRRSRRSSPVACAGVFRGAVVQHVGLGYPAVAYHSRLAGCSLLWAAEHPSAGGLSSVPARRPVTSLPKPFVQVSPELPSHTQFGKRLPGEVSLTGDPGGGLHRGTVLPSPEGATVSSVFSGTLRCRDPRPGSVRCAVMRWRSCTSSGLADSLDRLSMA